MDDKAVAEKLASLSAGLPRSSARPRPLKLPKPKNAIKRKVAALALGTILAMIALPPFFWPVRGTVTSEFLFRFKPDSRLPALEIHHGIDLSAPAGAGVACVGFGVVEAVGASAELGNYVVLSHPLGFSTLYAHLEKATVRRGKLAIPGLTRLGRVGATGRATGPHLHFAVHWLDIAVSPRLVLVFHSVRRWLVGF